jgi:hypothetical protein
MKKFAVVRTEYMLFEKYRSVYGQIIEALNFAEAVGILKGGNSTDVLGTSLSENIVNEDIENEIFSFKNDRARYKGDSFDLEEITEHNADELGVTV